MSSSIQPASVFLSDVKSLRDHTRYHVTTGGLNRTYAGDVEAAIDILQAVLATEIVCFLRYTQHSIAARSIGSQALKAEFAAHAQVKMAHAMLVSQRICQLGGIPDFHPRNLLSRSASRCETAMGLVDMITKNLVTERVAVDHYRELVGYFAEADQPTRRMIEQILAVEEEHANDMADLLVRQDG
ncbi:ferritin-like domain-containing protein [Novosphingobium sp. 1748]|uniref:ferritin-like domain-containing protein n=1 Tax=Novosphingobium sp. 1748 TaxID=2817760 RepID=UPI00286B0858|nr:ferritin-like domain-containing protein [Novosphingobium sp. 1748]